MQPSEAEHHEACNAAVKALMVAERDMNGEVDRVKARHAPTIREAQAALSAAKLARDNYFAEVGAQHPWNGKRAVKIEKRDTSPSWSRTPSWKITTTYGVFETISPANPWSGRGYPNPGAGALVVRLLKKDGTPGARHERYSEGAMSPWKLDGETAP